MPIAEQELIDLFTNARHLLIRGNDGSLSLLFKASEAGIPWKLTLPLTQVEETGEIIFTGSQKLSLANPLPLYIEKYIKDTVSNIDLHSELPTISLAFHGGKNKLARYTRMALTYYAKRSKTNLRLEIKTKANIVQITGSAIALNNFLGKLAHKSVQAHIEHCALKGINPARNEDSNITPLFP